MSVFTMWLLFSLIYKCGNWALVGLGHHLLHGRAEINLGQSDSQV